MTLAEIKEVIISSEGKELQDQVRKLVEDAQNVETKVTQ